MPCRLRAGNITASTLRVGFWRMMVKLTLKGPIPSTSNPRADCDVHVLIYKAKSNGTQ